MSYKIYYSDSVLIIDTQCDNNSDNVICVKNSNQISDITKLLQNLQNSKTLTLINPNPESIFDILSKSIKHVIAAGGLVTNSGGDVLMIRRFDRWDLPKGHLEPGETIEQCAMREVTEECGIDNLVITGFLTTTNHLYYYNDELVLKSCYWYSMQYHGDQLLTPQKEEDITDVMLVEKRSLEQMLKDTYGTIVDVFSSFYNGKLH